MERYDHTRGERPPRYAVLLLVCWVLVSTLIGKRFTAVDPDPSDVQLFAYIGLKWTQGALPYVDIWDNKPPGIFAAIAAVFLLFPKSFPALACLEGLFTLGCLGTVYGLTRQWGLPWAASWLATGSAAVASNLAYYTEHGTFPEVYLLWPATMSMYCFGKAAPIFRGPWIVLAGVCTGVASLFKPTGLSPLLAQVALVLLLWAVWRRLAWWQALASVLANGTGVLVAWLPVGLYFWGHHAWWELLNASWLYNVHYGLASQGTGWQVLTLPFTLATSLQPLASLAVCTLMGLVLYVGRWMGSRRGPASDAASPWWPLVLLWVGCDLAGALAGGRNYRHYFLVLAPSLSVTSGFTYGLLLAQLPHEARARGVSMVLGVFIVGSLIVAQAADVGEVLRRGLSPVEPPGGSPAELVAARLQAIRHPSDTLFTWDYLPVIYLATEMRSPARLLDAHYLYDFPGAYQRYGEELLRTLRGTPPTFIVGGWSTGCFSATVDEQHEAGDPVYRQYRAFLADHYELVYTAENLQLYQHRLSDPGRGE